MALPVNVLSRVITMSLYIVTGDCGMADLIVPPMAPRNVVLPYQRRGAQRRPARSDTRSVRPRDREQSQPPVPREVGEQATTRRTCLTHDAKPDTSYNGVGFGMVCAAKLFLPYLRPQSAWDFPRTRTGLAAAQCVMLKRGGKTWGEGAVEQVRSSSVA
jgi:hypothetical protein